MTSPISTFIGVQFIADADTPPESLPFAGMTFFVAPEYLGALGSGPSNPGVLGASPSVRGYHVAGGPTGHQWVMTAPMGNPLRDAILAISGAHGWTAPGALSVYRNVAVTLVRDYGVPAPTVAQALTNLYNAAVTNATTPAAGG